MPATATVSPNRFASPSIRRTGRVLKRVVDGRPRRGGRRRLLGRGQQRRRLVVGHGEQLGRPLGGGCGRARTAGSAAAPWSARPRRRPERRAAPSGSPDAAAPAAAAFVAPALPERSRTVSGRLVGRGDAAGRRRAVARSRSLAGAAVARLAAVPALAVPVVRFAAVEPVADLAAADFAAAAFVVAGLRGAGLRPRGPLGGRRGAPGGLRPRRPLRRGRPAPARRPGPVRLPRRDGRARWRVPPGLAEASWATGACSGSRSVGSGSAAGVTRAR